MKINRIQGLALGLSSKIGHVRASLSAQQMLRFFGSVDNVGYQYILAEYINRSSECKATGTTVARVQKTLDEEHVRVALTLIQQVIGRTELVRASTIRDLLNVDLVDEEMLSAIGIGLVPSGPLATAESAYDKMAVSHSGEPLTHKSDCHSHPFSVAPASVQCKRCKPNGGVNLQLPNACLWKCSGPDELVICHGCLLHRKVRRVSFRPPLDEPINRPDRKRPLPLPEPRESKKTKFLGENIDIIGQIRAINHQRAGRFFVC